MASSISENWQERKGRREEGESKMFQIVKQLRYCLFNFVHFVSAISVSFNSLEFHLKPKNESRNKMKLKKFQNRNYLEKVSRLKKLFFWLIGFWNETSDSGNKGLYCKNFKGWNCVPVSVFCEGWSLREESLKRLNLGMLQLSPQILD